MAKTKNLTPYETVILGAKVGTEGLELSFRGKVPTTNNAYISMFTKAKRMIRVPSPEHRTFKEHVADALNGLLKKNKAVRTAWEAVKASGFYRMVVTIYLPVFTKQGKVRRYDASNRLKIPEDAVMELLGVDDTNIIEIIGQKLDRFQGDFPDEQYYWSIRLKRLGPATLRTLLELKEQEGAAKALEGGYSADQLGNGQVRPQRDLHVDADVQIESLVHEDWDGAPSGPVESDEGA